MSPKILIIIPAYNEERHIGKVIAEVRCFRPDVDVVVINDCSRDDTADRAQEAGAKIISLPINLGIGGAVQTGFIYAFLNKYDIAIQVDGDGQHDPRYIPQLVQPILENQADVVIGSRFLEKKGYQSTFWRRCGIRLFTLAYLTLIHQKITDGTAGFRAYNLKAITLLKESYAVDFPEPEAVILLAKRRLRIKEIPVEMRERMGSISSITGFKSAYYMVKVLLAIVMEYFRKSK